MAIALFAVLFSGGVAAANDPAIRRLPPVEPAALSTPIAEPTAEVSGDILLASHLAGVEFGYEPPFTDPLPFEVGARFNKGLFIRARDLDRNPYALYVGGRIQLRYTGFSRDIESFTDNTGATNFVRNRNQFDIERARINFSGTAVSPNLTYLFILDADGDGGSQVDGLAFHFTYQVAPELKLRVGRWKVAADREWLLSSRYFRMADRSMATEYFRVGFSDGVWALGDFALLERSDGRRPWHYEMSLTNGLRTSSRNTSSLDDNLGAAATLYCDPLGAYGAGPTDFAWHESPVVRLGGSFAFDKSDDRSDAGAAFALGDDNFLRLSDGTRLSTTGSLAPGVSLLGDRVLLAAFDIGVKYRGWSLSGEYFIRSIQDLTADGPLPVGKLYDYGFHAEVGKFLIARRLDLNVRMSQVSGLFGTGFEYSAAMNYFWGAQDDRVNKFTLDVTNLIRNPVTSTPADLIAGDDGLLVRGQVQVAF